MARTEEAASCQNPKVVDGFNIDCVQNESATINI